MMHMDFMARIYWEQIKGGRWFLHEHPAGASSWHLDCIREIAELAGVRTVTAHMCEFGMVTSDAEGEGRVAKPTKFMTNGAAIAQALERKCQGGHRHIHLLDGKAARAGSDNQPPPTTLSSR